MRRPTGRGCQDEESDLEIVFVSGSPYQFGTGVKGMNLSIHTREVADSALSSPHINKEEIQSILDMLRLNPGPMAF